MVTTLAVLIILYVQRAPPARMAFSEHSGPVDIKPLPPKQAGIDRPCAGAQHRHANRENRQEDVNSPVLGRSRIEQRDPGLVERDEASDNKPKEFLPRTQ